MVTKLGFECQMLVSGHTTLDFVQNNRQIYETYRRAIRVSAPFFIPKPSVAEGGLSVSIQDVDLDSEDLNPLLALVPPAKFLRDVRKHIEG